MRKRGIDARARRRIRTSVLAGMLAAILLVPHKADMRVTAAWWGVLYPEFCTTGRTYADDTADEPDDGEAPRVKIKFRWLHGF